MHNTFIATLSSILDSQLHWESSNFQLASWSHRVVILSSGTGNPASWSPDFLNVWDSVSQLSLVRSPPNFKYSLAWPNNKKNWTFNIFGPIIFWTPKKFPDPNFWTPIFYLNYLLDLNNFGPKILLDSKFLGCVNDLHTWHFWQTGQPVDRPA